MKKLLLFIVLIFSISLSFAQEKKLTKEEKEKRERNIQAGNPFKEFGYKPKIATLSKGKYLEFHDLDSIVKIGSFTFHVKRKTINGYSQEETKYSEATLRPEIVSRWFSPDPLSEEFPSWSPYNFTMNNPIRFIDPDGRAPIDVNCCGFLPTGAGIGLMFRRFKNTANYMRQGNSLTTSYLMASGDDAIDATKQTLRYVTPVEDIYGVATGEDFYGNSYNRAEASGWAAASFIPFAKLGKLGKLGKAYNKADNLIEYGIKGADDIGTGTASLSKKGILELDFNVPKGMRGQGIGTEMFDDAVKTFGKDIKGIQGLWLGGDNLGAFNKAIKSGSSIQNAIFSTPTGKWAKKNGFNTVEWGANSVFNSDNTAEAVQLIFKK
ncbi:hypothetical protein [Polaribacter cellanae]|uniref:RHS repeat-associated core domain-containing protein n=1 Tax=Polaribacter cellanae TaxID=2818493 RepID=A0A975H8N3_9FLAO|nr:hypothetical protein [Polaribacter cellanae]QTE21825.1 hypothetical protein J3359_13510 [Polaribacter cellanae]